MRKLATVQTISEITPIEGADRIETARVLGWRVVVGKGEFSVGDKAVYMEIDSILPADNPAFESFQARGQKTIAVDGRDYTGHVLKTMKLRGIVSQGLLMSLGTLGIDPSTEVGEEVTDQLGIVKYEAPIPMGGANIVGPFQSRFAPKTDAIRLQNLVDFWDIIRTISWEPTVKVDGTSQTLVNDNGNLRIFGRNWELDPQVAPGMKVARDHSLTEDLEPDMAIQFELAGAGIQGNRLKLSGVRPFVFAVWKNGEKVERSSWPEAALKWATPVLGDDYSPTNFASADELINFVDGLRGAISPDRLDEGVVFHPVDPASVPQELADELDRNHNFKAINNKFLLKHAE